MRFALHYRGPLKPNGRPDHKHDLRRHFHHQIQELFKRKPLVEHQTLIVEPHKVGDYSMFRQLHGHKFIALVNAQMDVVAELDILLMRPEPPGQLLTAGGDMDNRLKTLFDALTMPRHVEALPTGGIPAAEQPLYCLLEDDNLVTSVKVRTEQLLEPVNDSTIVELFIDVHAQATRSTFGNSAFW